MADARLADGSRVNVVIPPLAVDGPALSVRRFTAVRPDPDELVAGGTLTPELRELLARGGRGAAQRARLRRHRLGQDDAAERALGLDRARTSGWSRSRTPPSCACASRTSSGSRAVRPRSRGGAR